MTRSISSQLEGNLPYTTYKEAIALQKKIQAISTALQTIQLEKANLESMTLSMQTEMFLQSRRDAYAARLSPFQRILPEIWERVFLHIPEETIVVSQVCRVWRRIVVAIPRLWPKELLVYLRPLRPREQDAASGTLYACMVRTSECQGLSICLLNRKHAPLPSGVRIRLNLRAIPRRTPLKTLYITSEFLGDLFGDTYLDKSFWAPLEELVIDKSSTKHRGGSNSLYGTNALSLSHLQSLTRLTVRMINRISPSNFHAPWQQLEYLHLDVSYSRVADYISILSMCQNLQTFILVCHTSVPRRESTVNRVLVSRLETLTIIGHDSVAALLTHLQLPVLKYLHLSAQMHPNARTRRYKDSGEDIMRVIETSRCTLIELTIHCIYLDDSDIPYCFRAMPKLRILRVADNGGMADLLACLRTGYRDRGGALMPLVPCLGTLLVETSTPAHWPKESFNAVCNLRRHTNIRGSDGNRLTRARLVLQIRPFSVDAELSRYVRSLLNVEGVTLDASYIAKRRRVAAA